MFKVFFPGKKNRNGGELFNLIKIIYKKIYVLLNDGASALIWGNMTRMFVLTIVTEYSARSQGSKVRKGINSHTDWKEEIKLSLFAEDMIVHRKS